MSEDYYTLGLDVGIGSCGWALLDLKGGRIVDMGVRLWDVPQEPYTKASTASTRRAARSMRRNTKRTADRKKHCLELLQNEGLVPQDAPTQWIQTAKGDRPTVKLRTRGLNQLLNDREWAQILYTLCSRRGYIPHGEGSDDTDGRKVLQAIDEKDKALQESGWRTVGEMLAHQKRSRNRGGEYNNCVSNQQIKDEIDALFKAQKLFGNEHVSDEFKNKYLDCLSWEKDITGHDQAVYAQVGKCKYFPDEPRAAKSCLSFEMCNAFERVGHTMIVGRYGSEHHLPADIRRRAIEILFSPIPLKGNKECKVRYSDIRKWLDLDADSYFKGIDKDKEDTTEIYKPVCWRDQRKKLPLELMERMRGDLEFADAIDGALTYSSSKQSLEAQLEDIDLTEDERQVILNKINFTSKIYSGYGKRSLKALDLLLSSFDSFDTDADIVTLYDAEYASGLAEKRLHGDKQKSDQLPPYILFDETCKNPVVLRVMGQVRKLINAISREYGVPGEIHIELARELKHSAAEKERIATANNRIKASRDIARKKLAEDLNCSEDDVTSTLINKYELWNEQNEHDLYTDQEIDYIRMITDDQYCQIDHILPYSRTYDDSRMNKVLVLQKSNQDKRERTPYEWLEPQGQWDDFCLRISRLEHYPVKKKHNFLVTDLSDEKSDDYIQRNLNDTRYASRETKRYIEEYLAFPDTGKDEHVVAVASGVTGALRNAWGIRKVRAEDNLHHALDAAVIAACDQSSVMQVAKAVEKKSRTPKAERKALFTGTEPWESFTEDLYEKRKQIIPTHMANHGVTGRAFEDTLYRFEGLNEDNSKGVLSTKELRKEDKFKINGNYVRHEDGSASIVDGLAFLRLWWDPEAPVRGRKNRPGRYLAEPVYYADIPLIINGEYVPLLIPSCNNRKPREQWDRIPDRILDSKPITLYVGDAIFLNGIIRRFEGINIHTNTWTLSDPRGELANDVATKGHSYGSIGPNDQFFVIHEDCLGHCFHDPSKDKC